MKKLCVLDLCIVQPGFRQLMEADSDQRLAAQNVTCCPFLPRTAAAERGLADPLEWMDGWRGRGQARPPERHTAGDCKCLIVTESQFRSMDHFCSLEGLLVPFFVLPPSSFSALCNLYPQSSESNVGASRMSESLDGR